MKRAILDFGNKNQRLSESYQARLEQHEREMAMLYEIFGVDPEEEPTEPQEITVEDIEVGLASVDTYRGQELDMNINKVNWLNDNIKLSDILDYDSQDNIVDLMSQLLDKPKELVANRILKLLGIKYSTQYQNEQKEYVDDLMRNLDDGLYEDLEHYMRKANLYDFYGALLYYIRYRISPVPQSTNEDELTFYVIYDDLRKVCKKFKICSGLTRDSFWHKLSKLCRYGLLTNLESEQIESNALNKAKAMAQFASNVISDDKGEHVPIDTRNFYVLNSLSPSVQNEALNRLKYKLEHNLREKDINSTTLAMNYGVDIQRSTTAHGQPDINQTQLRNFTDAANILLKKQRYFTEEQLRIQYMKKDRKIKQKKAASLTAKHLSITVERTGCIMIRVNKSSRKEYALPKAIKSNSYIYVSKEDEYVKKQTRNI